MRPGRTLGRALLVLAGAAAGPLLVVGLAAWYVRSHWELPPILEKAEKYRPIGGDFEEWWIHMSAGGIGNALASIGHGNFSGHGIRRKNGEWLSTHVSWHLYEDGCLIWGGAATPPEEKDWLCRSYLFLARDGESGFYWFPDLVEPHQMSPLDKPKYIQVRPPNVPKRRSLGYEEVRTVYEAEAVRCKPLKVREGRCMWNSLKPWD